MQRDPITVGEYLLLRLKQIGVDHLFGVPGDFVLGFLNQVLESDVAWVGTCNELNAAYAADGYARIRGIGALCTTYGVGELSAINGVAGAFAERVPVVVITGSPATTTLASRHLLHHTLGDLRIPMAMYERVTAASALLSSGETAPAEIDRVLSACIAEQQPVYLSLPSDVVRMPCAQPGPFPYPASAPSDSGALAEAVEEAASMLDAARLPLIIGDVELVRFKLQAEFAALLEKSGFPYVSMMLGKTVLDEAHPQFIGLFEGDRSRPAVVQRVAAAEVVLQLGAWMTDFNTGGFTAHLDDARTIRANLRSVQIGHHRYEGVSLRDFIVGLTARLVHRERETLAIASASACGVHRPDPAYRADPMRALTIKRLFDRVSAFLKPGSIVLAETGVSLFSAAETLMPEGATFIGQTFYGSIGYTVGATLGAAVAAPDRPVVLFVGDGAFQVTGQELSTMIRNRVAPVIFVLNNDGYTIERVIVDRVYNDLQPWRYHELPVVYGGAPGFDVRTEGELEAALTAAGDARRLVFIEVHTGRMDCPEALREAGASMARSNQLEG